MQSQRFTRDWSKKMQVGSIFEKPQIQTDTSDPIQSALEKIRKCQKSKPKPKTRCIGCGAPADVNGEFCSQCVFDFINGRR